MHHNIYNPCLLSMCLEMDIHLNKQSPTQGLTLKHRHCQTDQRTTGERAGRQSAGVLSGALLPETPASSSRPGLPQRSGALQSRITPSSYDPFCCVFKRRKYNTGKRRMCSHVPLSEIVSSSLDSASPGALSSLAESPVKAH